MAGFARVNWTYWPAPLSVTAVRPMASAGSVYRLSDGPITVPVFRALTAEYCVNGTWAPRLPSDVATTWL